MTQDNALKVLQSGKNVFLTGEPGSGKTYTINLFTNWLRGQDKRFAVTASTGIAATHINGLTIHSWCGLGIKDHITDQHIAAIMGKSFLVRKMTNAQVLIIDEISMLSAETLDNVDRILRHVRDNNMTDRPFGGLQVIFVGDFFQLPPISKKGPVKFAFEAESWKAANPTVCYLTEQHRQSDQEFLDILTAMRSGTITENHKDILRQTKSFFKPSTKLYTHNVEVDQLNQTELSKIDGEERTYKMTEEGVPFLCSVLKKSCLSPEKLVLRIGAEVMFTRNNFDEGYVNGTLGKVIEYGSNGMPIVLTRDGQRIMARYAEWSIEDTVASISQVPLRLAWAITVHKSQGMSLDEAAIDLEKAFEFGQGYVAISRVRSLDGLHLEGINDKAFQMHPKVIEKDKEFRSQSEGIN